MTKVLQGLPSPLLLLIAFPTTVERRLTGPLNEATSDGRLTIILSAAAIIAFAIAMVLFVRRSQRFWMPAAVGIVSTQAIIITHWEQAKYTTVLNIIVIVVITMLAAAMRFRANSQHQADALFMAARPGIVVTNEMISGLPQAVQRWLLHAGVVGKETPNKLIISERGMLRTQPDQRWMRFKATQHFSIDPPGFVWQASITAAPGIEIGGQDTYREGRGKMVIKPLYLLNASDGSGKEIDQGTLVRYLAEMAWFPQCAVSPYLRWQRINENEAQVTMEYKGVIASGVYSFSTEGDVTGFKAKRYGNFGGIYKKENWSVETTGYSTFNGVRIGNKSDVTWKLAEGDFHWLSIEVTKIVGAT